MKSYTVNQVARRTGITVRTLHHYEAEGLLVPARRSEKGYRLYEAVELKRLQHIIALKAFGFSLAEIRQCLAEDAPSLDTVLRQQITRLREVIMRQSKLLERIEAVANSAEHGGMIDADTLLSSIEASTMMEQHFTEEQLAYLRKRRDKVSSEQIREMKEAWRPLVTEFTKALKHKRDPSDADVQFLARRWLGIFRSAQTEDDAPLSYAIKAELKHALKSAFEKGAAVFAKRLDIDLDVFLYICAALKASKL